MQRRAWMILNASDCYFNIFQPMHSNIFQPCPTCTSAYQSDEGCRTDLFKRSQRKGVGYLLIIIAFSNHTHVCIEITTTSTMQRRLGKYGTHVHVATKLSNVSIQPTCLEKSSVDAHGLSSCLGCSRILWHLISFEDHHRDWKLTHRVTSSHSTPRGATQIKHWLGRYFFGEVHVQNSRTANANRAVAHVFKVYHDILSSNSSQTLISLFIPRVYIISQEFWKQPDITNPTLKPGRTTFKARSPRRIGCVAAQSRSTRGSALRYLETEKTEHMVT